MKQFIRCIPVLACCLLLCSLVFVAAPSDGNTSQQQQQQSFKPACPFPFDSIKHERPIDATCGMQGAFGSDNTLKLQNMAKNNFCVAGNPTAVTYNTFVQLQAASDKLRAAQPAWWKGKMPSERSALAKVKPFGEGRKVVFVGYVMDVKAEGGEAVNCGVSEQTETNHDIHIALMQTPPPSSPMKEPAKGQPDPRCNSVTAEMSPHFRPAEWDKIVSPANWPKNPVRITAPLMLDAEHVPCKKGNIDPGNSPVRISVWEMHPVYAFEVCTSNSLSVCTPTNNAAWKPFDQWMLAKKSAADDFNPTPSEWLASALNF